MMSTTALKFCLLSFLLLVTAQALKEFGALEEKLNEMAKTEEKIDNLFIPVPNGTIKRGGFGFVFKAYKAVTNQSVALKFVSLEQKKETDREFEMYAYLHAINNTDVEKYGFSALHYYNVFEENFLLTVFTYFGGGDLHDLFMKGYFNHKKPNLAINTLILFRDFIIQSKYMHSCGVRHDDIKPANIMVSSGSRSFLIDLNIASKFTKNSAGGTSTFLPKSVYENKERQLKSDWESFLYSMAFVNGIELGWIFVKVNNKDPIANAVVGVVKRNSQKIISRLFDTPIASPALYSVFFQFARAALNNQEELPPYDSMYKSIITEIEGLTGAPHQKAMFTWLNGNQKDIAMHENNNREFDVCNMAGPPKNFKEFNYPHYNLDFFSKSLGTLSAGCSNTK